MNIESLHQLYVHQLKDIYSAENQLLQALPKMAEAAESSELTEAFEKHRTETEQQVSRLESIFKDLDYKPGGERCDGMAGLIEEAEGVIKDQEQGIVRDAALIADAQRIEHYEISAYGTAREYARALGRDADATTLTKTFKEETSADSDLTRIAVTKVNRLAKLQVA